MVSERSGTDKSTALFTAYMSKTLPNTPQPEEHDSHNLRHTNQRPTEMSLSKPVQKPVEPAEQPYMAPPVSFSQPAAVDIQGDPDSTSSDLIKKLIAAAQNRPVLCTVVNVPWPNMSIDKLASEGGTRQRELHTNSTTRRSMRRDGFHAHKGTAITAVEIPWTEANWKKYIEAGHAKQGLPMPKTLRTTKSDWEGTATTGDKGVLQVGIDFPMEHRLFRVNDGCHRTATMHEMRAERHPHATEVCDAGILVYDADPDEDKNQSLITSIVSNVEAHENLDRDSMPDKLNQIKAVSLIYFSLTS